jgi:hypothetical protein
VESLSRRLGRSKASSFKAWSRGSCCSANTACQARSKPIFSQETNAKAKVSQTMILFATRNQHLEGHPRLPGYPSRQSQKQASRSWMCSQN